MLDSAWPEPEIALDGGKEGLDLIFRIIEQTNGRLKDDGFLLIEADNDQMPKIKRKMTEEGFKNIQLMQDLSGWNRIISGSVLEKIHNYK